MQKVATSVPRATIMEFSHNHRFSSRALPRAPLDRAGAVTRPPSTTTRNTAHRGATRRRVATRTATAPSISALRSEFQPRRASHSRASAAAHYLTSNTAPVALIYAHSANTLPDPALHRGAEPSPYLPGVLVITPCARATRWKTNPNPATSFDHYLVLR